MKKKFWTKIPKNGHCGGAPLDITALKPGEVYELHRYLKSKVCCFIFFAKLIFCVILLIGFLSSVHFKRGVWQKLLQSFDFMLLSNPLHQIKTNILLIPLQWTLKLIWWSKWRSGAWSNWQYFAVVKVQILQEGHTIWKNLPPCQFWNYQ